MRMQDVRRGGGKDAPRLGSAGRAGKPCGRLRAPDANRSQLRPPAPSIDTIPSYDAAQSSLLLLEQDDPHMASNIAHTEAPPEASAKAPGEARQNFATEGLAPMTRPSLAARMLMGV